MPTTDSGKAISSRNSTTHGVFARDVVLPALGEDPQGYSQLQAEWTKQLVPRNLLEQHYVEKIAAASWRLRRLHRWQAQLFEDDTLSEAECIERLNAVLRYETALQRQIDTAVRLLAKDVPQLYTRRLRDQVLEDLHVTERECRDEPETDLTVSLETSNRLYQLRKATAQAANELSVAPLDAPLDTPAPTDSSPLPSCQPSLLAPGPSLTGEGARNEREGFLSPHTEICRNELVQTRMTLPRPRHTSSARAGGELPFQSTGVQPREVPVKCRPHPRENPPEALLPGERCPS